MQAVRRWPVALAAVAILSCSDAATPVQTATYLSQTFSVDRVYRSMKGPQATQVVRLGDAVVPELVWITAFRTEIVDAEAGGVSSPEFMCHSNLALGRVADHRKLFQWKREGRARLFTLSQGQMEVRLPEGFGIPILSTERLALNTQVLNLNPQEHSFRVKHRTTIEYVRDRDTASPMRPLLQHAAQGMVLVEGEDGFFGIEDPDPSVHGAGCAVGMPAGKRTIEDDQGREFAAHWVVPPGRHVYRTNVTPWLGIPFDTAVHYIAVHVHPFAETVTLRDLTDGSTVYESRTVAADSRIGLEAVESFSSAEGIPVYAGHQYELVSVYDNTTEEDQDAMAVMFLYLEDLEFQTPEALSIARGAP